MRQGVEPLIQTQDVTKIYNRHMADEVKAVDRASVDVQEGEVLVLRGPSGSGKTSLLSMLGCMSRPTEGRILVGGKNVSKLPERFLTQIRRATFGFIFQQLNLIREVSVLENVILPLYPAAEDWSEMIRGAKEILAKLDIEKKSSSKVKQLSGGEQQRVAIARALINRPSIIVADEPTAHLDRDLSEEFLEILAGLNREGKTVVIGTHDPLVYEHSFVSRTVSMRDGRVEEGAGR